MPWRVLPQESEILAVHAAYLGATNQIIYFGGDEFTREHNINHEVDATRLFDVATGQVHQIPSPAGDVFCCGHAFLGDDQVLGEGRLLVSGGTDAFPTTSGLHTDHYPGIRESSIYHPKTRSWNNAALLNFGDLQEPCENDKAGGRWYPSLLTLADGSVLAMSGHPGICDKHHNNFIPEVFTSDPSPGGEWHLLGSFANSAQSKYFEDHQVAFYPRIHLLPTGDIVSASPTLTEETYSLSISRSPWSGTFNRIASFENVAGDDPFNLYNAKPPYAAWSTSVLLPLRPDEYQARILMCNAEKAFVLDLNGWDPAGTFPSDRFNWTETAPRQLGGSPRRLHATAVILATGEILVCGGVEGVPSSGGLVSPDDPSVLRPEIFDPRTGAWSAPNDPASVTRNYHSVALLLPDGTVWTAGSDLNMQSGLAARELRFEIYEPWYFGNPDRPHIDGAPERVYPDEEWPVNTQQANRIQRVAMVRCGSSTHAFIPDQRYIELPFRYDGADVLMVRFPPTNNIMVPGYYFLYVINDVGLPSWGTAIYARPHQG